MPKPSFIEDRSVLVKGLCVVGARNDENDHIGAIRIDGVTVSYSISEGPGLNPMQAMDLLTAIEAISSRFPTPWLLPAGIYLRKLARGYLADVTLADGVTHSDAVLFACEQIGLVADFVVADDARREIHLLVGDDEQHRAFHAWFDHVRECPRIS